MQGFTDVKANSMQAQMLLRQGQSVMIEPKGLNTLLRSMEIFREHTQYTIEGSMKGSEPYYFIKRKENNSMKNMIFADVTAEFIEKKNAQYTAVMKEVPADAPAGFISLDSQDGLVVKCQATPGDAEDSVWQGLIEIYKPLEGDPDDGVCAAVVSSEGGAWGHGWRVTLSEELFDGLCKVAANCYHYEAIEGFLMGFPGTTRMPGEDF